MEDFAAWGLIGGLSLMALSCAILIWWRVAQRR